MEVDTSNECGTSQEQVLEDKPIMRLFKNLIWSDSKENTVLTNAQIIELLQKDFKIDTSTLHELELEIYLHIVKRFLKEWPQWDEFDPIINKLRDVKDKAELYKYLNVKYDHLKHYLTVMLDTARPRAKEKVKEVQDKYKQEDEPKTSIDEDVSDVILEIHCTRDHLNELFYRKPHPDKNDTIFNALVTTPNRIHVVDPSMLAILNWWNVAIILKYNTFHIVRSTVHESNLTLVNKKLRLKQQVDELNKHFQEKSTNYSRNLSNTSDNNFLITLPEVIKHCEKGLTEISLMNSFNPIFETLAKDFKKFPAEDSYKDMVWYRKYMTKYPYKRYLCSEVNTKQPTSILYDLKLKETISPMYQIHVMKLEMYLTEERIKKDVQFLGYQGIQLECRSCNSKFQGVNVLEQLKQHILENHFNEPDWQCMRCKETFTMVYLAEQRWRHVCNSDNACL